NRNLGKFYTCVEILGSVETDELDWLKKAFAEECKKENTEVFELKR
ncbi:MAG: hypothetical protein GXO86_01525, partial [Chlorobi bacterium]|nr:hypothetical protein [Chlorobiota bacterium]